MCEWLAAPPIIIYLRCRMAPFALLTGQLPGTRTERTARGIGQAWAETGPSLGRASRRHPARATGPCEIHITFADRKAKSRGLW